jgi:D-allose transport system ATP-binding protein
MTAPMQDHIQLPGGEVILSLRGIGMQFPGTIALRNVGLDLHAGEVHVLLGENGAGKTTLMKIITGIYRPTSGSIRFAGEDLQHWSPALASEYGVRLIAQELSLIDELTIAENLHLRKPLMRRGLLRHLVDWEAMNSAGLDALRQVGLSRSPSTLVAQLSLSEKQQVEIAKALSFNSRLIIMDEPTSSLTETERQHLFGIIRRLREQGAAIIYITHKLEEVELIGDRVTVLKDGACMATKRVCEVSRDQLVSMMVGRNLTMQRATNAPQDVPEALRLEGFCSRDGKVRDVSLAVGEGEILGFAGLIGSGRSELMETIYGIRNRSQGKMWLGGRSVTIHSPQDALQLGIGFITEDRRRTGFFPNFNILQNICIMKTARASTGLHALARLKNGAEGVLAASYIQRLRIRCATLQQMLVELSGGNQQKAIIAKWLAAECSLFIFDEPTRGIDVGAKEEIYAILRELAAAGQGILLVSSELPELLAVCHRIAVFREGRIVSILNSHDATEERIIACAAA